MPTVPINTDTLTALLGKVSKLSDDKKAADDATAASNAAHATLQKALTDADRALLDEAARERNLDTSTWARSELLTLARKLTGKRTT